MAAWKESDRLSTLDRVDINCAIPTIFGITIRIVRALVAINEPCEYEELGQSLDVVDEAMIPCLMKHEVEMLHGSLDPSRHAPVLAIAPDVDRAQILEKRAVSACVSVNGRYGVRNACPEESTWLQYAMALG
jgi:hypothetical protein